MHSDLIENLKGITVALSTALTADGGLDEPGMKRLIDKVVSEGVSCVFPLGWCGEGPLLTDAVRRETIEAVCRYTDGRVPVMAGVSEHSLGRMEELVRVAESAGADCVLATMPYGYELSDDLVYEFFQGLAALTKLPIVIYENSELRVFIGVECLSRLAKTDNIIGVKATVPPHELRTYYSRLHKPESFAVISGDEDLYAYALLMGIRHFTMGGPGNNCAGWCVSMYEDAVAGRMQEVMKKQQQMMEFLTAIYQTSATPYGVIKYILERFGICESWISSPHRMLTKDERREADRLLQDHRHIIGTSLVET